MGGGSIGESGAQIGSQPVGNRKPVMAVQSDLPYGRIGKIIAEEVLARADDGIVYEVGRDLRVQVGRRGGQRQAAGRIDRDLPLETANSRLGNIDEREQGARKGIDAPLKLLVRIVIVEEDRKSTRLNSSH